MTERLNFDCPLCSGKNQLRAIQNRPGNTLGYHCRSCRATFKPECNIELENNRVILLARQENPELARAANTNDCVENVRRLNEFRNEGRKQFLDAYVIGEESLPEEPAG